MTLESTSDQTSGGTLRCRLGFSQMSWLSWSWAPGKEFCGAGSGWNNVSPKMIKVMISNTRKRPAMCPLVPQFRPNSPQTLSNLRQSPGKSCKLPFFVLAPANSRAARVKFHESGCRTSSFLTRCCDKGGQIKLRTPFRHELVVFPIGFQAPSSDFLRETPCLVCWILKARLDCYSCQLAKNGIPSEKRSAILGPAHSSAPIIYHLCPQYIPTCSMVETVETPTCFMFFMGCHPCHPFRPPCHSYISAPWGFQATLTRPTSPHRPWNGPSWEWHDRTSLHSRSCWKLKVAVHSKSAREWNIVV